MLSSVQFNGMILLLIVALTGLVMLSALATYERIKDLALQERLLNKLVTLDRNDLKFSQIESSGIIRRLPILIDKLEEDTYYEFVNKILIKEKDQRKALIKRMRERYPKLAFASDTYFNTGTELADRHAAMVRQANAYRLTLYPVSLLQTEVLYQYYLVIGAGFGLIMLWTLFLVLMARQISAVVLGDIHALLKQDSTSKTPSKYNTHEMNAIALRLRQQSGEVLTPSKQDPVTQLPNYEGVKSAFEQRPIKSKNLQVAVCVFEIDSYAKLVNHYPQSVIDPVLIKIASIMKLHKMQNDHVGRIGDSLFIAVFVRSDRQKALSDCDHIRQMIEENRFKLPHNSFPITVSGGFAVKTASQTLDDAVKNAKEYLNIAQEKGGNLIAELKKSPQIL